MNRKEQAHEFRQRTRTAECSALAYHVRVLADLPMDDDLGEVGAVMVECEVKSKLRDWAAA
jgi:hypothetical protein